MAADLETIEGLIVARLAAVTVAGGYHYDLNGQDQVVIDNTLTRRRDVTAAVAVFPDDFTSTRAGVPLGYHKRTAMWQIFGWVKATADTPAARSVASQRLLDDIATALEDAEKYGLGTQASPGTIPLELKIDGRADPSGGSDAPTNFGAVIATLTVMWRVRRGM